MRLTINQIRYYWECSIIGPAKSVRPHGYSNSEGAELFSLNVANCVRWVESLPLHESHGEAMRRFLRGTPFLTDVELWHEFWDEASVQLVKNPVFAACEDDSAAKIPITYLTTQEVAERLKKPVKSIRRLICERGHGLSLSYRDDKGKWHFHPDELDWFRDERKKEKKPVTAEVFKVVEEVA